jgi:hypothetical protein
MEKYSYLLPPFASDPAFHFVYYKLKPPMTSKSEKSTFPTSLTSYEFDLQSKLHEGRLNVAVDFSPVQALNDTKQIQTFSIVPQFNHDYRHYTNAFCTPYEGVYVRKQMARYKQKLKEALRNIYAGKIVRMIRLRKLPSQGRKINGSAGFAWTTLMTT